MQQLEKSQLQHVRPQPVSAVEAAREGFQVLVGQPGNQIDVHMDVSRSQQPLQVAAQLVEVGLSADRPQRRLVEALQPRFHLEQPRRGRGQQIERPIVEEIRPYLKVEADTAWNGGVFRLFDEKAEQIEGPFRLAVEGAIHQLDGLCSRPRQQQQLPFGPV